MQFHPQTSTCTDITYVSQDKHCSSILPVYVQYIHRYIYACMASSQQRDSEIPTCGQTNGLIKGSAPVQGGQRTAGFEVETEWSRKHNDQAESGSRLLVSLLFRQYTRVAQYTRRICIFHADIEDTIFSRQSLFSVLSRKLHSCCCCHWRVLHDRKMSAAAIAGKIECVFCFTYVYVCMYEN